MELGGWWVQPVYYFNSTNLSCDFKIHFKGSCFISFYFSDHLTPYRERLVSYPALGEGPVLSTFASVSAERKSSLLHLLALLKVAESWFRFSLKSHTYVCFSGNISLTQMNCADIKTQNWMTCGVSMGLSLRRPNKSYWNNFIRILDVWHLWKIKEWNFFASLVRSSLFLFLFFPLVKWSGFG